MSPLSTDSPTHDGERRDELRDSYESERWIQRAWTTDATVEQRDLSTV